MDRSTVRESQPWTDQPHQRASHGQIYHMRESAMDKIYLMREPAMDRFTLGESQLWTDLP